MAKQTSHQDRSLSLYQVFPRNYSAEGTLKAVTADLDRIAAMGFDYLYLVPVCPIGEINRKGDLGSPYAIRDYRQINPEIGTLEDFTELVEKTHQHGMKIMIDIVLNHTSPDHYYVQEHPEYYYRRPDGGMGNRVGEWTDVLDLDYRCRPLWDELIDMLCLWAERGVDGFRCDVASLVPTEFWMEAREAVAKINPDHFWLAESIEGSFVTEIRSMGFHADTDSELYQAFDCLYDYDIYDAFKPAVRQTESLIHYKRRVAMQEWMYPENYLKARFLENHDQPRIYGIVQDQSQVLNWTAWSFFAKGTAFVYAGQEAWNEHQPSLFTKDLVDWSRLDPNYERFLKQLNDIRRMPFFQEHRRFIVHENAEEVLTAEYQCEEGIVLGVFNVRTLTGSVKVPFEDGTVMDIISGKQMPVQNGVVQLSSQPMILTNF